MVERPLSMREAPGSMPGFSSDTSSFFVFLMTTTMFGITEILVFYVICRVLLFCFVLLCFYQKPTAKAKDFITLLT